MCQQISGRLKGVVKIKKSFVLSTTLAEEVIDEVKVLVAHIDAVPAQQLLHFDKMQAATRHDTPDMDIDGGR